ncbi:unnamed protein product [Penicillium olsonii]|uniref:Myb-like domain-containing protein n=1 Tax=Penicillium olsonii TaxID=99116 RepID=A0A9W4I176_PENOL|nr:unnamed protein product [Penicillium olsonii]CAG8230655.1 unnamed protein product [Penicillium olsonii]
MSATLASPYRGFMVNFTHHVSGKDTSQDDIISYGALQLLQDRPEIRFQSDTLAPFGSPSSFLTDRMIPRQTTPHHHARGYDLSPQGNRKRQHEDDDSNRGINCDYPPRPRLHSLSNTSAPVSESTELTYPVLADHLSAHPPSNHDYLPPVSLPIPQQHHHHRLPAQAMGLATSHSAGGSMSGNGEDEDMSFLKHDGLPAVLPIPKGPKTKFGPAEDATLIQLKEHWNFTWKQIQHWFPGRTSGTLQVRYCTKLKAKNVVWTEEMVCWFPLLL